jgi:hypothetical protein
MSGGYAQTKSAVEPTDILVTFDTILLSHHAHGWNSPFLSVTRNACTRLWARRAKHNDIVRVPGEPGTTMGSTWALIRSRIIYDSPIFTNNTLGIL